VPVVELEQVGFGHEPCGGHHVFGEPEVGLGEVLLQGGGQHGQLDLARGRSRVVVYSVDQVQVDGSRPEHAFAALRRTHGPAVLAAEEWQHQFPDDSTRRAVYEPGQI